MPRTSARWSAAAPGRCGGSSPSFTLRAASGRQRAHPRGPPCPRTQPSPRAPCLTGPGKHVLPPPLVLVRRPLHGAAPPPSPPTDQPRRLSTAAASLDQVQPSPSRRHQLTFTAGHACGTGAAPRVPARRRPLRSERPGRLRRPRPRARYRRNRPPASTAVACVAVGAAPRHRVWTREQVRPSRSSWRRWCRCCTSLSLAASRAAPSSASSSPSLSTSSSASRRRPPTSPPAEPPLARSSAHLG